MYLHIILFELQINFNLYIKYIKEELNSSLFFFFNLKKHLRSLNNSCIYSVRSNKFIVSIVQGVIKTHRLIHIVRPRKIIFQYCNQSTTHTIKPAHHTVCYGKFLLWDFFLKTIYIFMHPKFHEFQMKPLWYIFIYFYFTAKKRVHLYMAGDRWLGRIRIIFNLTCFKKQMFIKFEPVILKIFF